MAVIYTRGSGYVSPVTFTTTTSSQTTRHTRIYYKSETKSDALTAYGFDLEVIEGAEIDIVWYTCEGFNRKVVGFLNKRTSNWVILNTPQDYFMSWLGISWINFPYIKKWSLIIALSTFVSFIISSTLGIIVGILGFGFWYMALGKALFGYLKSKNTFAHFVDMNEADFQLKTEFFHVLQLK